jgi:hypothetical protein
MDSHRIQGPREGHPAEIVKAIVEGRPPRSLTVKVLLREPMTWPDQRAAFGSAVERPSCVLITS